MLARHDFQCEKCGHREVDFVCNGVDESTYPKHCGSMMVLDWMQLPQSAQIFESFVTRHIDPEGKPIKISSKGDLEWAAREYGVRRDYDDPDLVAVGNEIRKKTPTIGKVFDMGGRR